MEQQPHDFDRIAPTPVNLGGAPGDTAPAAARRRALWPVIGLATLAGIALFVILILPSWQHGTAPVAPAPTAGPPEPQPATAAPAPVQESGAGADAATDEKLAAARREAQELQQRLRELDGSLQRMGVEAWAAADYAGAAAQLAAAERAYLSLDYPGARDGFRATLAAFESIALKAQAEFDAALKRGNAALSEGNGAAAASAFAIALTIRPDDAAAQKGARRAAGIEQVMALMRDGEQLVRDGNLNGAVAAFQRARELDPDFAPAGERLQAVRRELAAQAYRAAMSAGFAALEAGQLAGARGHFAEALRVNPGAPEAADALRLADTRLTSATIEQRLAAAAAAEQAEDWGAAVVEYEAALKLDPNLRAARTGLEQAAARSELDRQLTRAVAQPERLADDAVYEEAAALLARAAAIAAPGAKLKQQAAVLSVQLQEARTPIPVTLVSDGETEVTVYRVGNLGRFTGREITLRPGRHVIVGTRAGFRDVRVELNLAAGAVTAPVEIRCVDSISPGR